MNIVDLFTSAVKELKTFEEHPLQKASLEDQMSYLNMLALMAKVDGEIHENEKGYLQCLIKCFGLDGASLAGLIKYAKAPNKESIQVFIQNFKQTLFAEVFLFDTLIIIDCDKRIHRQERALYQQMKNALGISATKRQCILRIYTLLKGGKASESAKIALEQEIKTPIFEHVAKYYDLPLPIAPPVNKESLELINMAKRYVEALGGASNVTFIGLGENPLSVSLRNPDLIIFDEFKKYGSYEIISNVHFKFYIGDQIINEIKKIIRES